MISLLTKYIILAPNRQGRPLQVTDASTEAHSTACTHPSQKQTIDLCEENWTPSSVFLLLCYRPLEFSSLIPKGYLIQVYIKKSPLRINDCVTCLRRHSIYHCCHLCDNWVFLSRRNGAFWRTYFDESWSTISWVPQLQYSGNYSYRTLQDLECFLPKKLIKATIKN